MDRQTRKEIAQSRRALREHAEHYYGEQDMTRMDWVKAVVGGIVMTVFFWAFTAFMFVM